jgi:hypothetical protein
MDSRKLTVRMRATRSSTVRRAGGALSMSHDVMSFWTRCHSGQGINIGNCWLTIKITGLPGQSLPCKSSISRRSVSMSAAMRYIRFRYMSRLEMSRPTMLMVVRITVGHRCNDGSRSQETRKRAKGVCRQHHVFGKIRVDLQILWVTTCRMLLVSADEASLEGYHIHSGSPTIILFVVRQTTDKPMARHGMPSILSKDAPVSDCVQLQEIITDTRSRESEIRFKGLLQLVENVWETSSQISGEYMATPT